MSIITFLMIKSVRDKEQSDDEPDKRQKLRSGLLRKIAGKTAKSLLRLNNKKTTKQ
ncbi:MAG: hypothetical protein LLF92_10925 [Planctomycetaceae bacterium]|jgi:hypothetical protein|nr:hypothetical protein [Planctomycetaceae bacterium]